MDLALALLGLSLFVAPLAALIAPAARRPLGMLLAFGALGLAAAALAAGDAERELLVSHAFPAYVGQQVRLKEFAVETAVAPGWRWAALAALWAALWAAWALRARAAPAAFVHALALAWGGAALVLAWQKCAAPPAFAGGPLPGLPPIEPPLLAGTLAGAVLLALRSARAIPMLLYLSLFIAAVRLPVAMFGTLATRSGWGTSLDVRSVDFIVNLANQQPVELAPGSDEQLLWTVWFPQLMLWPALSMMSAGGIAFAVFSFARHPRSLAPP
jgi:hypothetical protein